MEFLFHPSQDNIVLNQMHFIVAGYVYEGDVCACVEWCVYIVNVV